MKTTLSLIPVLAVAALALTPSNAAARGENELVRLTHNIEGTAAELRKEFQAHYKHSSAYRHLISDVSKVLSEAAHIDGMAHDPRSSLRHIKADLVDLDELAHHLHEMIDAVDRGCYGGHVDGNTRHVHSLLDSLSGTIHRMEYATSVHDDHHGHAHDDRSSRSRVAGAIIGRIFERSGRGRRH